MTALTPPGPATSDQRRRMIFFLTSLGSFMATLDLSIVNIAFPTLERSFPHDHANTLAWVITGYSIVFGALLVIAGRTADRVGARRVFFAGLLVFCLGSVLSGVAPSVGFLVGGRIIQGAGGAAILPPSLGLLLAAYPADRRIRIVALWAGISALAVATGPTIGALLITAWGWRAVFFVNLPIGLMTWVLGRRVLPALAGDSGKSHPDYRGAVLLAGALALIVLAISQGGTWGWATPGVIGSLAGAVVLGAAFLYRSARHNEPVLDLSLFRSRQFTIANAATFVYGMGFFAMLLGNILFLTSVWHFSTLRAGLLVTPGPIVVAIVSGRAGKIAAKVGFRPVLLVGFAFFTAGLCWYRIQVGVHPAYLAEMLPGQLIAGLGIGLTFPILGAAAVSTLPFTRFSVGSAVGQTSRQIGGAIGVAILVVLLGTPHSPADALSGFDRVWTSAAITAVAAALVCSFLVPPRKAAPGPSVPAHSDVAGSAEVTSVQAGGAGIRQAGQSGVIRLLGIAVDVEDSARPDPAGSRTGIRRLTASPAPSAWPAFTAPSGRYGCPGEGAAMSPRLEPEHLNNHHRNTLRQLFEEPESHNIEWHAVLSLLDAVGSVAEHHDGTVTVKVGAHTEYLDPPTSKDIDPEMVADLRRLLARAGYQG